MIMNVVRRGVGGGIERRLLNLKGGKEEREEGKYEDFAMLIYSFYTIY